jgi:hypothetical protein
MVRRKTTLQVCGLSYRSKGVLVTFKTAIVREQSCWWCAGGVLVVCWWCAGGVLVQVQVQVLVVCWWCAVGVLVLC